MRFQIADRRACRATPRCGRSTRRRCVSPGRIRVGPGRCRCSRQSEAGRGTWSRRASKRGLLRGYGCRWYGSGRRCGRADWMRRRSSLGSNDPRADGPATALERSCHCGTGRKPHRRRRRRELRWLFVFTCHTRGELASRLAGTCLIRVHPTAVAAIEPLSVVPPPTGHCSAGFRGQAGNGDCAADDRAAAD